MGHFARECPEYTGIRRPESRDSRDRGDSRRDSGRDRDAGAGMRRVAHPTKDQPPGTSECYRCNRCVSLGVIDHESCPSGWATSPGSAPPTRACPTLTPTGPVTGIGEGAGGAEGGREITARPSVSSVTGEEGGQMDGKVF